MRRLIVACGLAAAFLSTTACNRADDAVKDGAKAAGPAGGLPPLPPYQMRDPMPSGNRLASGHDGKVLFTNRCGACHLPFGMGTNLLTKQRIALGEPPEKGLLMNRTDLTADYVKSVVRQGKMAMPRQTKVDITDAELDAVAAFLAKAGK